MPDQVSRHEACVSDILYQTTRAHAGSAEMGTFTISELLVLCEIAEISIICVALEGTLIADMVRIDRGILGFRSTAGPRP